MVYSVSPIRGSHTKKPGAAAFPGLEGGQVTRRHGSPIPPPTTLRCHRHSLVSAVDPGLEDRIAGSPPTRDPPRRDRQAYNCLRHPAGSRNRAARPKTAGNQRA